MSKKDKKKAKMESCDCQDQECECESGSCGCGCDHEEGFERQFYTREEKIQMLEDYLEDLKAEQKGVEEALEELRKPA